MSFDEHVTTQSIRNEGNVHVVNLSSVGIPLEEAKVASVWIAKAFAQAPAEPALAIFFGTASYEENTEMHEAFWASHLGRVAKSGVLLGARNSEGWQGFRCLFPPGQGWEPYSVEYDVGVDNNWERFLELTGKEGYMERVQEWGRLTGKTHGELDLTVDQFFTTSMIVVNPSNQHQGIGRLLDEAARDIVHSHGAKLFVRIHEHIVRGIGTHIRVIKSANGGNIAFVLLETRVQGASIGDIYAWRGQAVLGTLSHS